MTAALINPTIDRARDGGPSLERARKFAMAEPVCLSGVPTIGGAWGDLPAAVVPAVSAAYSGWTSDWIRVGGLLSGTFFFVVKDKDCTTFKAAVDVSDDPDAAVRTSPADDATSPIVVAQANSVGADSSGTSPNAPTEQEFTAANFQPTAGKGNAFMQVDFTKGVLFARLKIMRGTGGSTNGTHIGAKFVGGVS